jgi:hypothetical protein
VLTLCVLTLCVLALCVQDPLMKAQAAAASTSGVVRVPHIPVGADVSSSAAASEAITDTSSVAGAWGNRILLRLSEICMRPWAILLWLL